MSEHLRFDTSDLAPRDRFEYWRERVVPLRLEPLADTPRDFPVRADVLRSGGLSVIEMTRGPARAAWRREAGARQGRLRLILLAPAPAAAASWYGVALPLHRGGAALVGASDGWWRAPAGMHGIEVDVPREAVAVSDAELARIREDRRLWNDPVLRTLIRPMLAGMSGNLPALAASAGDDLGTAWASLLTMLVRSLALRDLDGVELMPARRVQAERFIQAHLHDPRLTPDSVAAALHMSRRALYACMPEVATHIRLARLARARVLLSDPARAIASVAACVGLPNPAHFSRLFRAEYGHSPREFRDLQRARNPALRVASGGEDAVGRLSG